MMRGVGNYVPDKNINGAQGLSGFDFRNDLDK